jgi:hypothetical protein
MPHYRVRFLKTVCNDIGRQSTMCQRSVEVEADSPEAAIGPARARFCELERIGHWSFRADSHAAEEIAPPPLPRLEPAKARSPKYSLAR